MICDTSQGEYNKKGMPNARQSEKGTDAEGVKEKQDSCLPTYAVYTVLEGWHFWIHRCLLSVANTMAARHQRSYATGPAEWTVSFDGTG